MRNRWNVDKETVIAWSARLDEGLLVEVLRHAEACGVHRVCRAPDLGYDERTESRAFSSFVSDAAITDPLVPLTVPARTSARVAYATPDGEVVEDEVSDLGAVLEAGAHAGPLAHRPALRLSPRRTEEGTRLRIGSYSDIWLPWCSIRYERGAHVDDLADNRELAGRHTPRLNEFLAGVAELARGCGGELRIDPDSTAIDLAFQIDDDGVRLQAEDPQERSEWEHFENRHGADLADALLAAAVVVEGNRPPAPYRAAIGAWTNDPRHPLFSAGRVAVRDAVRAARIASLLDGSTRVMVQTGRTRYTFEPDELAP